MKLLLIGNELNTPRIRTALEQENCEIEVISSRSFNSLASNIRLSADAAFVSRDHGHYDMLTNMECLDAIPFIVALGVENNATGISNLSPEDNALCNRYYMYGGEQNLRNLLRFVKSRLFGEASPEPPQSVAFDSIYTFGGVFYENAESYLLNNEQGYSAYVGILSYRSQWQSDDLDVVRTLKKSLNARGIGVICAFSSGTPDEENGCLSMEQAIERFFCTAGRPRIALLINFMIFGMTNTDGANLYERAAEVFKRLDIPVIRPVQSNYLTNEKWIASPAPFLQDAALNFDMPEMQGMIEPVFVSGAENRRAHIAVEERVDRLSDRIAGWINLRRKKNQDKKIAIILNNAVCSGVEATLGKATGLNAFESIVSFLRRLKDLAYETGKVPENGAELRGMFLDKKAHSDFRWTSAEDILASGGALYEMTAEEYGNMYAALSPKASDGIEAVWGSLPGSAMVVKGKIIITGLRFGNVLLMIQPKRGCHGAKCTGEVCKILQDPACPPTHQYLASYWYAQNIFEADAFVHFGTHGSLEFLPGKSSGLSGDCYSDIAVGKTPNLYVYNASLISSALIAKRRSYAVTVSHKSKTNGLHILLNNETDAIISGLNGGFIRPGHGGDELEEPFDTGRNLYGVMLNRIPTREAYERGAKAAEALVESYMADEGRYPNQIALNMVSLDIPRTGGEQMSQMLRLLGVRPVWNERGVVTAMECIPLSKLKRPRMDVTVHISSVLRDTWPDVITRLDEAIALVASQDESPEENYIIKNIEGPLSSEKTTEIARIFGGAPGTFTNSIGLALKASAWKYENDLARYFIDSSSHVYGKGKNGERNIAAFLDNVKRTDVTCDIISIRHTDAINSSYSSRVQGGYTLAAKSLGLRKRVRSYMGESSSKGICVKTLNAHLEDGLRNTLLNEDWKKNIMQQGYDGAAEVMCRIQNIFEMQCVNESFSSGTLEELARQYATEGEMRRWLEENNVFAVEETSRRFLELESRGKWKATPDVLDKLRRDYLRTEASLEDGLSGLGEIQAGNVDIFTDGSVTEWKKRLSTADAEIEQWKKRNS